MYLGELIAIARSYNQDIDRISSSVPGRVFPWQHESDEAGEVVSEEHWRLRNQKRKRRRFLSQVPSLGLSI